MTVTGSNAGLNKLLAQTWNEALEAAELTVTSVSMRYADAQVLHAAGEIKEDLQALRKRG